MDKLSEIEGFKRLYAYFESNKVRQGVKRSVQEIHSALSFDFDDIPDLSDEQLISIIRSNHKIYGTPFLLSIASGILLSYFGAFSPKDENVIHKKTDRILSVHIEYMLRQIRKCKDEFRVIGIKDDKLKKILDLEAVILTQEEKYEVFKNIINLQIINHDPKNKTRLTTKELCQDREFLDLIGQVRVIIFGNVIEFTQSSLDNEGTGLLDIFGLRGMNAVGISADSEIIGLKGKLKFNLVGEKTEESTYNTYLHELWHATEGFISNMIGELIPGEIEDFDIEDRFSKTRLFRGMRKEDILSDFRWLARKHPELYRFMFGIENRNYDIDIGYLKINEEFVAQLIGTEFFNGQGMPTSDELISLSEDMTMRLINYIKPFNTLLRYPLTTLERHFDIDDADYIRLLDSVEKYFNLLFKLVFAQIQIFTRLSLFRGNRQSPFIELGFVPLNKWESYVKTVERKLKR